MDRSILAGTLAFGFPENSGSFTSLAASMWEMSDLVSIDDAIEKTKTTAPTRRFSMPQIDFAARSGLTTPQLYRLFGELTLEDGDQISVESDLGMRLIIDGDLLCEHRSGRSQTTKLNWTAGEGVFAATLWFFVTSDTGFIRSNLASFIQPRAPFPRETRG